MALRSPLNESEAPENIPLCYDSVNGSCPKFTYPIVIRFHLYVLFGTTVVITVIGNLLVIITVAHFKQLHTPTNYLIFSLAVADLLVGGIVMPPSVMRSVESCWYLGELFCKIHSSTDTMCCTASIINLTMISIDRFFAIKQPLLYKSKITIPTVVVMISMIWSLSGLFGFGMVFLEFNILGMEEFYDNVTCEGGCVLLFSLLSSSSMSVLAFYMPGMILVIIYMKILIIALDQEQTIQNMNLNVTRKPSTNKMERKATKTLAIVVGVFVSSWIPYFLAISVDPHFGYVIPPLLYDIFVWVGYLNSTFNPMVYAYFYSWFRRAFQIIVSGKIFQKDSSTTLLF